MRKTLLLLVPVLLLSACSWGITMDDAAKNVRTAWSGDVSSCKELGKVTVSVMDHVGPVDRNTITVRDELEVLARNQAAQMHADTIKPLAEPSNGSQPWGAYQCGAHQTPSTHSPSAPTNPNGASGNAQTFPVHGG
ncbi:hypothetical protein GCM10008098_23340 [Rhodanobacter panaciterrae]|uniref:DUF4156 domain-containing protein n=1 Tax=Rhodanobacter panaciterrae TaxID=490572 RepID=A0ABQ2ZYA2_9GAMM|nr:DUF4156 domain-containing protein [Rhodanobacter panaciterrae]GGY29354.1 hypothetical protein GCM10008098_23340 [Rhodanobacter panaciterrae]